MIPYIICLILGFGFSLVPMNFYLFIYTLKSWIDLALKLMASSSDLSVLKVKINKK